MLTIPGASFLFIDVLSIGRCVLVFRFYLSVKSAASFESLYRELVLQKDCLYFKGHGDDFFIQISASLIYLLVICFSKLVYKSTYYSDRVDCNNGFHLISDLIE